MIKRCEICAKELGEITRSRLLKRTRFLCNSCWGTVKLWKKMAAKSETPGLETFNSIFGLNK